MPDDITMGELARRLDRMESRMDTQFAGVHRQIEGLQFVNRDTYEVEMSAVKTDIADIKKDNKVRYQLLAGGLVTLTVALIAVILGMVAQ
jgi:hypothetical protein